MITRYAELGGLAPATSSAVAYAVLDGLFQQALLHQLAGRAEAGRELKKNVSRILGTLAVEPASAGPSERPAGPREASR